MAIFTRSSVHVPGKTLYPVPQDAVPIQIGTNGIAEFKVGGDSYQLKKEKGGGWGLYSGNQAQPILSLFIPQIKGIYVHDLDLDGDEDIILEAGAKVFIRNEEVSLAKIPENLYLYMEDCMSWIENKDKCSMKDMPDDILYSIAVGDWNYSDDGYVDGIRLQNELRVQAAKRIRDQAKARQAFLAITMNSDIGLDRTRLYAAAELLDPAKAENCLILALQTGLNSALRFTDMEKLADPAEAQKVYLRIAQDRGVFYTERLRAAELLTDWVDGRQKIYLSMLQDESLEARIRLDIADRIPDLTKTQNFYVSIVRNRKIEPKLRFKAAIKIANGVGLDVIQDIWPVLVPSDVMGLYKRELVNHPAIQRVLLSVALDRKTDLAERFDAAKRITDFAKAQRAFRSMAKDESLPLGRRADAAKHLNNKEEKKRVLLPIIFGNAYVDLSVYQAGEDLRGVTITQSDILDVASNRKFDLLVRMNAARKLKDTRIADNVFLGIARDYLRGSSQVCDLKTAIEALEFVSSERRSEVSKIAVKIAGTLRVDGYEDKLGSLLVAVKSAQ